MQIKIFHISAAVETLRATSVRGSRLVIFVVVQTRLIASVRNFCNQGVAKKYAET